MLARFCLMIIGLFGFGYISNAQLQPLYTYQQLSDVYYAAQKDSLKKAWDCPDIYPTRATQKKFREIWDDRTDFIVTAIEQQNYVYEPEVYNYLLGIVNQITAANPQLLTQKPFLLLDRSSSPNAYALGGNLLAINLGLVHFSRSREELALAIAHELSHNILNHPENAMKERAEWLTSEDYKNSLKDVLSSKYGRFSRLKKILEGFSFSRSKHQRYHENDADSLAIILLKNSHISFNPAYFLHLDSADIQYKQPLNKPLEEYFSTYRLTANKDWMEIRSKGLSTRKYNFTDTTGIEDSLKTHPDCVERYKATLALGDEKATVTPIPPNVYAKATKMLIWNMFDDMKLTASLYRILQEKDKGNKDEWYDFMLYNIFAGLYYNDKELHRFNAIGVTPKEYISQDYYQLQTMLEKMPAENILQYCTTLQNAGFWASRAGDEKNLQLFISSLSADSNNPDKARRNAAADYINNNATSRYCEFASQFKKN